MFKKLCLLALTFSFISLPIANASLPVSVEDIPPAVDADIYTITINTEPGAKVTVTGGTSQVPPATDLDEDGIIKITIGLIQNSENTFSILAEKDGDFSETLQIIINENTAEAGNYAQDSGADITPPSRPILDKYETEIDATTITLTGIAEIKTTIIAAKTDGTELATSKTNDDGTFSITAKLEQNQRNRINVSAKDNDGNISTAIQAVIVELGEAETKETEDQEVDKEITIEEQNPDIEEGFTDIADHWAKEYIEKLQIAGIVSGKSEGIFAPDVFLTRAELTKIALNAFEITLDNVSEKPFQDVSVNDWFAQYVETAKNEEIVKGYTDGFHPNQNVTRAEAIKILLSTTGLDIPEGTTDFKDVAEGAWYEKYVAYAQFFKIVGGYNDGTFQPNKNITRAEIAKITVKTMELYSEKMAAEEKNTETTKTGSGTELVDGNRLYENTNFDFSLQYYKNWYYETTNGDDDDIIIKIGFSTDEDALENAEATLELKNDDLEELQKENLDYEKVGTEIRYFLDYNDSRHIEIYGDTEFEGKIKTMAETLEIE